MIISNTQAHVGKGIFGASHIFVRHWAPRTVLVFAHVCFCLFWAGNIFAQKNLTERVGTLVEKSWAKTVQSYCAPTGGSRYYVLEMADGSELILDFSKARRLRPAGFVGRSIRVLGKIVRNEIPYNPKSPSPQPIGGVACDWLRVKKLTKAGRQ